MSYQDPIARTAQVGFKYPLALTTDMHDRIKAIAVEKDIPKAVLIRTALGDYIERYDANQLRRNQAVARRHTLSAHM
jgi:predicted DNA-binding protein